jgi:murein DD-endopeptidase MepM/ murein hydrolase activator NlpD
MKRIILIIAVTIVAASVAAVFSYKPVSLFIYKIKEPFFKCPIITGPSGIALRRDGRGDGEYGSKRRNGRTHTGIDIIASLYTPVYAAKSGIAFRGEVPTGYGKYIMIYHPEGWQTYYGHLSDWAVRSTQYVRQGELIGYVGKTGNASSKAIQSHLHFEIRKDGDPQDPKGLMK